MDSQDLLVEVIAANNRTTRAVRAFVRFLFIQLTATTTAVFVWNLGNGLQDASRCLVGVCPPSQPALFLAGLIWLVGVIWSSIAGWTELSYSEIPTLPSVTRPKNLESESDADRPKKRIPSERSKLRLCHHCGADLPQGAIACVACDNWV